MEFGLARDESTVRAALRWLLEEADAEQREREIARLTAAPEERDGLWVVSANRRLLAAAWAQPQPGRVAALSGPICDPGLSTAEQIELGTLALSGLSAWRERRDIGLVQALLSDERPELCQPLERHRFLRAAELLYLGAFCDAADVPSTTPEVELTPIGSDAASQQLLTETVERTYIGTLDCPLLSGQRAMADVLAGYAATGDSGQQFWRLARVGGKVVGCLLLAWHKNGNLVELVYVGVTPEARGRGYGAALSQATREFAVAHGAAGVLLAVDANNHPARSMYEKTGYVLWNRRFAWLRLA